MSSVTQTREIKRVGTGLPGPGRPKGLPNRVSRDVKSAIAQVVAGRIDQVGGWLDRVAESDPARACELFARLAEFVVPRQRHVSGEQGELRIVVNRGTFVGQAGASDFAPPLEHGG